VLHTQRIAKAMETFALRPPDGHHLSIQTVADNNNMWMVEIFETCTLEIGVAGPPGITSYL
jgi:hypothetical protein